MAVLITGDTGFIGTNLQKRLMDEGVAVRGYSKRNGCDILNSDQLRRAIDGCDLVYHLAAYANPAESLLKPEFAIDLNVRGTMNVLAACRDLCIPMVYVSSCEIYGDSTSPITEEFPLRPPNPYAASKAAADVVCHSYYKCYGADVKVVRLFNPYGPHQQLNKILPTFYSQLKRGEPLTLFGDGSDTRDYVFADDIARGLYIAKDLPKGEVINLATGAATTTLEFAQMLLDVTGLRGEIAFVDYPDIFGGIKSQTGSGARAASLLGWEPQVPLTEGMQKTIQWLDSIEKS